MADYTLSAKVTADSKDYVKEMEKAERATEEFKEETDGSSQSVPKLGGKMSGLVGKISAVASTLGLVKMATDGISYNATMEQYETSFATMTGSAEKARETVEKLKDVAQRTPFEMPQLADTTQLLMNYGLVSDDAISKMTMLGDIAQGNADKMSRIATAYGQMSSSGKVALEDVKQMIEAGFNPLQEISESTGESMASLYDRISKGTISVDEITASMVRSTSEGGKYFNSMNNQSDTLNGKLSTLSDTFQSKLGSALEGVTVFLRDTAIPVAIDMLENWEKYEPVFTALAIVVGALTLAYGANALGITTLTGATGVWATVSGLATTATTTLGAAFAFLTTPIGLIIVAVGAVIAVGYLLVKNWETVKATGEKIWNGITNFINKNFLSKWRGAWEKVTSVFGNLFGGLANIAKTPINAMIKLVNKAISDLNKISVKIPSWVPGFGGKQFGLSLKTIPYLLHGTENWQGGFAYMNEGGRGELVNLPNGTQVIPHDISVQYAKESARANAAIDPIDMEGILDGVVINITSNTNVDGTPLKTMVYKYVIDKINNKMASLNRSKGGYVHG